MERDEILLREYESDLELFKFYLEISLKVAAFYYALTGALLSFYLTHATVPFAKWALLLPIILAGGLVSIFLSARPWLRLLQESVAAVGQRLELDMVPTFQVLDMLLVLLGIALSLTGVALIVLLVLQAGRFL
jgi:hypothetical protein